MIFHPMRSIAIAVLLAANVVADEQFDQAERSFATGDYATALETYRVYLETDPEGELADSAAYRVAESLYQLKQHEAAAAAFDAALKAYPEAREAARGAFQLGRARLQLEQPEAALEAFRLAAASDDAGVRGQAALNVGDLLLRLERYTEAAGHYRGILKTMPEHPQRAELLFTIAYAHAQGGKHRQAIEPLRKLLELDPAADLASRARLLLSDAYVELGQTRQAVALLEEMLAADPDAPQPRLRLAWALLKQGDQAAAAPHFLDYAERHPTGDFVATALYNAGIISYNRDEHGAAIAAFQRLRKLSPKSEEAREVGLWLGNAAYQAGNFPLAISELDAVLEAATLPDDDLAVAAYTRAEALASSGNHTRAIPAFAQLVERWPESAYADNARYAQARALHAQGQTQASVDILRNLLAQDPEPAIATHARYALAEYLLALDRLDEALPHLQSASSQRDIPRNRPQQLHRLGWVQLQLERYDQARETFAELAKMKSPYQTEAEYLTALAADQLGDTAAARTQYQVLTEREEQGPYVEKAYYRLAFLLHAEEAEANLAAYQERFPTGEFLPAMRLDLAQDRLAASELDAAEAHFRKLIAEELPAEIAPLAWTGLGWTLYRKQELAAADAAFARAAAEAKDAPDTLAEVTLQRGEIAYRQDRLPQALGFLKAVADARSASGERALYLLGWLSLKQEEPREAQQYFQTLVSRFPNGAYYADSALQLALILKQGGRFDQALAIVLAAIPKAQPELQLSLNLLHSDLLVATKQWEKLLEVAAEIRERWPDSMRLHQLSYRQGLAYHQLGQSDKAEAAYRETIAATDTIEAARAQLNLGRLYADRQAWGKAATAFLRVVSEYPRDESLTPQALHHAIDAFIHAEGANAARLAPHIEQLNQQFPNSPWTQRARERIKNAGD